jgi:error-prone DNA polymerase
MLTHLNVTSGFSFQYGTFTVENLVKQAKKLGFSHLALTDYDTLAGVITFAAACQKENIKPILGVNFKINNSRVVVLAKNSLGYSSLCRLVSLANQNLVQGKSNLKTEDLFIELKQNNLIVLLGPHSNLGQAIRAKQFSLAQEILNHWLTVGKNNIAIEIVTHQASKSAFSTSTAAIMLNFAKSNQVRAILTNAVRYLTTEDAKIADVLDAVRTKQKLTSERIERSNSQGYLKNIFEMAALAQEVASAANQNELASLLVKFTEELAIECALDPVKDLGFGTVTLPETEIVLNGQTQGAYRELVARCEAGLTRRDLLKKTEYRHRLEAEFAVVAQLGFASYFLTVAEVVNLTKQLKIRVAARGSGAGSLVNFALGISAVDPVQHGLLMERFLSPLRTALPDIDVDVESHRRLEVYDAIINRFGANRAICLSMRDTYRVRHAIRDVGAALGYPANEIGLFAKSFPHIRAKDIRLALSELPELKKSTFHKLFLQGKLDTYLDLVEKLDGLPRNLAMHPCGVILSNDQLLNRTSVVNSASGYPMSEFDKDDVENLGFLKLDVLGVRMQSALSHAVSEIEKIEKLKIDLDQVDLADIKTFDLIKSTKVLGCFQIESPGQRELIGKFSPEVFNDLTIDISLFRPGPMKSDMISPFLMARGGFVETNYLHDDLKPILEETWGVVVFHEQVIKIISTVTGCSLAEADEKRRQLGSFEGQLAARGWFTKKALEKYSLELTEHLWDILQSFASFGFCKAHAAAFALPTYQSAWLKAHYPAAFFAGVLTHDPGMYPKRLLINDAKNFKINVLPLDINLSDKVYRAESADSLRISLSEVRGISEPEVERILQYRPFTSLADFWHRARVSRAVAERLILTGAFDSLYDLPNKKINRRDLLMQLSRLEHVSGNDQSQLGFGVYLKEEMVSHGLPDLTLDEVLKHEIEILGIDLTCHLTYFYKDLLKELNVVFSKNLLNYRQNSEVFMAGVKVSTQTPPVRSGKRVIFLTIDDTTGPIDAAFFEDAQKDYAQTIFNSWLLLVRGRIRRTGTRGISLVATGAWDLTKIYQIYKSNDLAMVEEIIKNSPNQVKKFTYLKTDSKDLSARTLLHPSGMKLSVLSDSTVNVATGKLWHASSGSSGS